jgi:transposase
MRVRCVGRSSARKTLAQAINQMPSLVSTGPEAIRAELRELSIYQILNRCASYRPAAGLDVISITKGTLRLLARRAIAMEEDVRGLDRLLKTLVDETAPNLVAVTRVGTDVASALLVAAGDNPQRLNSEATFAHLCGVSPIDASSGEIERHRLNRGGDRQSNAALWHIVLTRMVCDPRTRHYIERRI